MGILQGRRALVVGVTNHRSIAWGIAETLAQEGAQLTLTYHRDRSRQHLEKLVTAVPEPVHLLPLDVADDGSLAALGPAVEAVWDCVDIVVHSVAVSKPADLQGRFVDTSRDGWQMAQDVSSYSLVALTRALLPLVRRSSSGSVLALSSMGAVRVLPHYNVMGPAKASLESAVRYLAHDLGAEGIRVNAISAGPIKTLSAAGVKGLGEAFRVVEEQAPLHRNITLEDVGHAAAFLASDWAANITGQILYVDAGHHIMGL